MTGLGTPEVSPAVPGAARVILSVNIELLYLEWTKTLEKNRSWLGVLDTEHTGSGNASLGS